MLGAVGGSGVRRTYGPTGGGSRVSNDGVVTARHDGDRFFPLLMVRDGLGVAETPEVFAGRSNAVLVYGSGLEAGTVGSWVDWLEARSANHPGFQSYALTDDEAGELAVGTCTRRLLVDDPPRVLRALGIPPEKTLWVLAVSSEGLVHHAERGPYTQDAGLRLADALMSVA